eukprot:69978_1
MITMLTLVLLASTLTIGYTFNITVHMFDKNNKINLESEHRFNQLLNIDKDINETLLFPEKVRRLLGHIDYRFDADDIDVLYDYYVGPNSEWDKYYRVFHGGKYVLQIPINKRTSLRNVVKIKKNNGFYCTGTLINPTHVLTAAHCIGTPDRGPPSTYTTGGHGGCEPKCKKKPSRAQNKRNNKNRPREVKDINRVNYKVVAWNKNEANVKQVVMDGVFMNTGIDSDAKSIQSKHDWAVLILENEIDAKASPMKVASAGSAKKKRKKFPNGFYLASFRNMHHAECKGRNKVRLEMAKFEGLKQGYDNRVDNFDYDFGNKYYKNSKKRKHLKTANEQQNICKYFVHGQSGAPVLIRKNRKWLQIGVWHAGSPTSGKMTLLSEKQNTIINKIINLNKPLKAKIISGLKFEHATVIGPLKKKRKVRNVFFVDS